MKPKPRIFDQNDSFSSYSSSNYGYSQGMGRQIGNLDQMIQRTEKELLLPANPAQNPPSSNLFQSFFQEGKKNVQQAQQTQVFASKQEMVVLQQNMEKLLTKSVEAVKQENEVRFSQLLKVQEQHSTEQAMGKDNLDSLQLLESRINLIEQEHMQRTREKDGQIARLEEVQRQLEDKLDQKVARVREMENHAREAKAGSQARYDEIKKKLMEVECRLSDCASDNTRLQLSQKNSTGQLQTQIMELEELLKISMNQGRKTSDGRKITEEELVNKYEMLQNEQENLSKQFNNFTNNIDSLLQKQQKQQSHHQQAGDNAEHGHSSSEHGPPNSSQSNSIQQMAPILRKSQEYITKEAHDDKYYQQMITPQEDVSRQIEHKIPMQMEMGKEEEENGEMDEEDLVYQVDENGYLIDDQGQYILDEEGQFIKFDDQQIDFLEKNDMMQD